MVATVLTFRAKCKSVSLFEHFDAGGPVIRVNYTAFNCELWAIDGMHGHQGVKTEKKPGYFQTILILEQWPCVLIL